MTNQLETYFIAASYFFTLEFWQQQFAKSWKTQLFIIRNRLVASTKDAGDYVLSDNKT